MKKRVLLFTLILLFIPAMTMTAYAHPGRTDGNGGHTDQSTGDYHYHHGYPAHDHYDMDGDGDLDCPYEFDDQTNNGSNGSNNETWKPNNSTTNQSVNIPVYPSYQSKEDSNDYTCSYIAIGFVAVVVLFSVMLSRNSKSDMYLKKDKEVWQGADFLCALFIIIAFACLFTPILLHKSPIELKALSFGEMLTSILSASLFGSCLWSIVTAVSMLLTHLVCGAMKKDAGNPTSTYWLGMPLAYILSISLIVFE